MRANSSSQPPNPQHSFHKCVVLEYFFKKLERDGMWMGPLWSYFHGRGALSLLHLLLCSDTWSSGSFKVG